MKHATESYVIFSDRIKNIEFLNSRYAKEGELLAIRGFTSRHAPQELAHYQESSTPIRFDLLNANTQGDSAFSCSGVIVSARPRDTQHGQCNIITQSSHNQVMLNGLPEDIRCIFFSPESNDPRATFNAMLDALAIHYALKEAFNITIDIRSRSDDGIFGKKLRPPKENSLKELIHNRFPHLSSVIYSSSHATAFDALSHPLDIAQFVNSLTLGQSVDRHQPKPRVDSKDFAASFERARTPWTERVASRHTSLER